jgi:hypothetical protein
MCVAGAIQEDVAEIPSVRNIWNPETDLSNWEVSK